MTGKTFNIRPLFFLKGKAGAGCEMKVSNFSQVLPFPNGCGIWIIEEKNIFMDFFDGFFERFFHYIEKHVNLSIENLPSYDTYELFVAYYLREIGQIKLSFVVCNKKFICVI